MNGGGVEQVVMNYYHYLDRSRVQFDFVVTENSTLVPREELESLGARVFTVPAFTKLPAFKSATYRLFCAHPEWRIVHSHLNALNVFPLHQAAKAGISVRIAHSHSTAGSGRGEAVRNAAKTLLRTQANRYPTVRFACGRYAGEWLFGKCSDFTVIPNAIDLGRFAFSSEKRTSLRAELGISQESFVVCHLGRFMAQKNHSFLVDIFAELLKRRPSSVLLLAGEGPLMDETKRKADSLGIQDSIHFLGQRSDVDRIYCASDVLCMPSLYEGLPVTGVEAQASGLPLLISDQVTDEILITGRARKLALSAGPVGWADIIMTMEPTSRLEPLSESDQNALASYDIVRQGLKLTEKYLQLYGEVEK